MALTKEDLTAISQLFDNRFDKMENRLDKMENRLDKLESSVSALQAGQAEMRKDIRRMDERIEYIYGYTVDNWGDMREVKARLDKLEKKAG